MSATWNVLSRKRGNKVWHRHIPGFHSEQAAREAIAEWTDLRPDAEFEVRKYERGPAPTYPNGQVRGSVWARSRRRR